MHDHSGRKWKVPHYLVVAVPASAVALQAELDEIRGDLVNIIPVSAGIVGADAVSNLLVVWRLPPNYRDDV